MIIALDNCPQCGCPVNNPGFCSEKCYEKFLDETI